MATPTSADQGVVVLDLVRPRHPAPFVLPVRPDPAGVTGPTPGQARGPHWRRTSPSHYVPAAVDSSVPEQRIAEAVPLLPPRGAVTGWAALLLHGAGYLDGRSRRGDLPVRLTVGTAAGRARVAGVHRLQEPVGRVLRVHGVPVHEPVRALADEMRLSRTLTDAVVAADMTLACGLVRRSDLEVVLHGPGTGGPGCRTGVRQARRALALSDVRSGSPPETDLRLVWLVAAGLPRPLVNVAVWSTTNGERLGYPDLLDEGSGLAVEYDGEHHRRLGQQTADNLRQERMVRHGLTPLRVTALDLRHEPSLVARLRDARARALASPAARSWTLVPPWERR